MVCYLPRNLIILKKHLVLMQTTIILRRVNTFSYYGAVSLSNNGGAPFTIASYCNKLRALEYSSASRFDGNNIYIGTNDGVLVSTK